MDVSALAVLGLSLAPFAIEGAPIHVTPNGGPWRGFKADQAVLTVVRVQELEGESVQSCPAWSKATEELPVGLRVRNGADAVGDELRAWAPWNKEAMKQVDECDDFPCLVKLSEPETKQMEKVPKEKRRSVFLNLIAARVQDYLRTGLKRETEYSGPVTDSWAKMKKEGLISPLSRPESPQITARIIDIAPGKLKPLRQVIDRRFATRRDATSGQEEATVWLRDVYTDHYFDTWGEWIYLVCQPKEHRVAVAQAIVVELDGLKDTDIFSRMGRPRMRAAVEEYGNRYLDRQFDLIHSVAKTDVKLESKTEAKPESKTEAKPESKTDVKK